MTSNKPSTQGKLQVSKGEPTTFSEIKQYQLFIHKNSLFVKTCVLKAIWLAGDKRFKNKTGFDYSDNVNFGHCEIERWKKS